MRKKLVYLYPGPRASGARRWPLIRLALHKRFGVSDFELPLRDGSVFLAAETIAIDQATLHEVFLEHDYEADFRNATVLDLGAHKGYFGAYALSTGAASVISYEPERQNFAYLRLAVDSFRSKRSVDWRAYRAAIGGEKGKALLSVSSDSWAHSLHGWPEEAPRDAYEVDVLAAEQALAEAASMPGDRLIAKIDVEGSECAVVCSTPVECWQLVDEVLVEHHKIAPCAVGDIVDHLTEAGLQPLSRIEPEAEVQVLRFTRELRDAGREAAAPSARV